MKIWFAAFLFLFACASVGRASEPHTPITVEIAISHAPAVNEQATATITVTSTQDAPGTTVELVLPEQSSATKTNWTVDLVANKPVTFTSAFTIRRTGNATVSGRARKMFAPDNAWGDMKSIPLTIRNPTLAPNRGGGASKRGWTVDTLPRATLVEPGNARIVSNAPIPFSWPSQPVLQSKGALPRTTPNFRLPAQREQPHSGTVTLTGGWYYTDRNGNQQPIDQQLVEVLKSDGNSQSPAVYCFTDAGGSYSCTFNSGSNGNSFAVAVRSWTNFTDRLGVFASVDGSGCADSIACSYSVSAPTVSCSSGQTCAVGSYVVGTGVGDPWLGAMWMTQDLIRVYKRLSNDTGGQTPGPGRIGFPAPLNHGTHAHVPPADGWIAVEPPAHTSAHPPTHEYGHVVMANKWANFAIKFPTFDCGSSHDIPDATGTGCALIEGWPDFWSAYGTGDPAYLYTAGGAISNFETRSGYRAWASGDQVEGNVAAVMWDMYDSTNDGPDNGLKDRLSDGIAKIWATMNTAGTNSFAGWWQLYQNNGYAACPALEIIQYDTIPYTLGSCPNYTIATSVSGSGSTTGAGTYMNGTSVTLTATPSSGFKFVSWTEGGNQVSTSTSYTFTAGASRNLLATFVSPAEVTAPTPGSVLSGASVDFSWSAGSAVTNYFFYVGTTVGGNELYGQSQGTNQSVTVSGLPTDGRTLYVRLWSLIGGTYYTVDYAYTAATNYTIAVSASPGAGGTVGGGGSFTAGSSRTVTASPNSGYSFVNWTEGGNQVSTSASYNFTLNGNRTLVANFVQQFTIGVSASPVAGGQVAGGGTFTAGSSRNVLATPNSGYSFVNWTEGGSQVSTSASYTFTLNGNRTLVANFTQNFTIAVSASPAAGGQVAGGGTFAGGSSRNVLATPNSGYSFVNWTEGGSQVSTSASYTFTLNGNRTLVANFTQNFTIAVSASPAAGGQVAGGGTFAGGSSRNVLATPNSGYSFVNWTESGSEVSTSASYNFTLNGNRTLVANFAQQFTIGVSASPVAGGTVGGGGTFGAGTSRTVTASANSGYSFVNWTESGSQVSTSASYTFTLNGNRTLVANFVQQFTIGVSASPAAGGTVGGAGTFTAGSSRTVTASANSGYSFVNWTENGSQVSTSASYTFTLNGNRTLVAHFSQQQFTIGVSASPAAGGTVGGGGSFAAGSSRTVTATANSGYSFVNWTESGSQVSTSASYTFTLNGNRTLVANFRAASATTLSGTPNPSNPGESVTLKAKVQAVAPATGTPTGQVTFKEGPTTLGVGNLSAGQATLSIATLTSGRHKITASYGGSATFSASNSLMLTQVVDSHVGDELAINTETANSQQMPAVAAFENGGHVVVWASKNQEGASSGYGIFAQRFNTLRLKAGAEFQVNTHAAGDQTSPAIAALPNNTFVVTWTSSNQDGSGAGIYAQRYNAIGKPLGVEFRVNTTTAGDQSMPAIAALPNNGFVITWTSSGQDGSGLGIYAQRFNALGKKAGAEFRVNTTTDGDQSMPSIASIENGYFIIAWASDGQDGSGDGVYAQRFNMNGKRAGLELRANTRKLGQQTTPSVAGLANNEFVIAWASSGQDGAGYGIYAQHFKPSGLKQGEEFQVNTTTASDQTQPSVSGFPGGGFVATWTSKQDGSGLGVYTQAFDSTDAPVDIEVLVNTTKANDQSQPRVAASAGGDFMVVWTSDLQDGSLEGVYGQFFHMDGFEAP